MNIYFDCYQKKRISYFENCYSKQAVFTERRVEILSWDSTDSFCVAAKPCHQDVLQTRRSMTKPTLFTHLDRVRRLGQNLCICLVEQEILR